MWPASESAKVTKCWTSWAIIAELVCGTRSWSNEDALHPQSRWTWTNEFRRLLGFRSETDFPNVCQSWSDKLHPDDAGAHLRGVQ